ncbi:MAG TPA: ChaN family lipoprotein [Burkholderiaceae bacterium]|nr:ChaN family lipoprotein [Burkholderiaceae bacterium]
MTLLASVAMLAGCAATPSAPPEEATVLQALATADVVLLGEVHDNAEQHRIRAGWLRQLAGSRRFALVMEQFDVEHQPAIDAALRERLTPRELAERASFRFKGWRWPYYEPYVALAGARSLPLYAGNLPSARIRAVRPETLPAISDAARSVLEQEIRAGHCNLLPEAAIVPMVNAQRARDAGMAEVIRRARRDTGLPVVLLAGNGHTRADVGVPIYLRDMLPGERIVSVGVLESLQPPAAENRAAGSSPAASSSSSSSKSFDVVVTTARQSREDPCEAFARQRAATSTAPVGRPSTNTQ